jgi:hypothetical protein
MAPIPDDIKRLEFPRPNFLRLLLSAMTTGTVASLATTGTLGLLARLEGQDPLQPINATSHWLHGPQAGRTRRVDLEHTGVGYATNHAAAVFWALPFTWWLARHPRRSGAEIAAGAAATAAVAAVVDYGLVPRRLTPGWEHAVSSRSVATAFGALALGLAAGALVDRALRSG